MIPLWCRPHLHDLTAMQTPGCHHSAQHHYDGDTPHLHSSRQPDYWLLPFKPGMCSIQAWLTASYDPTLTWPGPALTLTLITHSQASCSMLKEFCLSANWVPPYPQPSAFQEGQMRLCSWPQLPAQPDQGQGVPGLGSHAATRPPSQGSATATP